MAAAEDEAMGDFRRLLALPIVALMACGSLSACYMGPDPVQYAALGVADGKASAVVALCGRPSADVSVYRNDDDPDDNVLHDWSVTVTVPGSAQDVDVELLGAARPGWEITSREDSPAAGVTGLQIRVLRSFEAGHRYRLNSSDGGPEGTDAPTVTFSTDDLARIGEGQVLAATDYKELDVVSRESFVRVACAKKGPGAT
jgi:hypothetical protein